jgi:hypothetical protein
MKGTIILINVFIVVLVLIIVANIVGPYIKKRRYPFIEGMEPKKQKLDLGNILCSYYHRLLLSILKQEDFNLNIFDIIDFQLKWRGIQEALPCLKRTDLLAYENGEFIQQLPLQIPFETTKPLYFKLKKSGITLERLQQPHYGDEFTWRVNDALDEQMHTIMKPFIHKIIDDALVRTDSVKTVGVPVIHFRCADTPFVRNPDYALQKHCFFQRALEDIQRKLQQEFKEVIILSFINHRADENQANACTKYVSFLKKYLEDLQYRVDIQSESSLEDFSAIFYAPASISTSSSFSFMAGFFGKGIFISTTNGFFDGKQERCLDCGGWVYKGYNLRHTDVDDYLDTDAVLKKLQDCGGIE